MLYKNLFLYKRYFLNIFEQFAIIKIMHQGRYPTFEHVEFMYFWCLAQFIVQFYKGFEIRKFTFAVFVKKIHFGLCKNFEHFILFLRMF